MHAFGVNREVAWLDSQQLLSRLLELKEVPRWLGHMSISIPPPAGPWGLFLPHPLTSQNLNAYRMWRAHL